MREQWRKEDPDDVETVETVQVVNALTGDVVEFICDGGTNQSDDILLGVKVEAFSSWQKKLYNNGDDVLTLLPDEWAAFYAETWSTFGDDLQDSNGPRKAVGHEQELADKLKGCVAALAEAGKDFAKSNPHAARPNLYEKHSQVGAELLAKLKAEVTL